MGDVIYADAEIIFPEVLAAFPNQRIFSATEKTFKEFDRTKGWIDISYDDIFSAPLQTAELKA